MPTLFSQALTGLCYPHSGTPVAASAAALLHAEAGAPAPAATDAPAAGLVIDAHPGTWSLSVPDEVAGRAAWMWLQLDGDGNGVMTASSPALLYALAGLIADGLLDARADALAEGLLLEPAFSFHRPLYDVTLTQTARTTRDFAPEPYIEQLARAGFTHLEVNGLAFHIPFEPGVPTEYYNQFYTYCPGFNHFVDSTLTRGVYPAEYLQANLNRVKKIAALGRKYGLKPGLLTFEPRSLPEHFFQQHPTLRGARIDHPFRSHLPRYTLAQDHPVARDHYRQLMRNMMAAVPDLDYLSVWTNDSGAGFEHTSSLYVGRNGGPYMIREWREHEQIAETAGKSALRWLRLMQQTAAETNPDFEVLLRIEPFKVEHETIMAGMGDGLSVEAPSLLVRGYDLPYHHPEYPDQSSAAGSIFHTWLEDEEGDLLEQHRAAGFEPKMHYAPGPAYNLEPLLGIPFPRMLHRKLKALQAHDFRATSALGGLLHLEKTPYWPNPAVIRAAQLTPDADLDEVLHAFAARCAGEAHAAELVEAWDAVEEAVRFFPIVPLYSHFGFVWLRTWTRPLVPDIEAIPEEERLYYERFLVSTANNPNINDLGRDVLFELLNEESGRRKAQQFDANALPHLDAALERLGALVAATSGTDVHAAFVDLYDRTRALRCWATTQRNTCAWVAGVYGFLRTDDATEQAEHRAYLQDMIDRDLENTRRLLDLWTTTDTEIILVSDVGETSFVFGENLADQLERKIELTEQYRHHDPRIDPDIMWKML